MSLYSGKTQLAALDALATEFATELLAAENTDQAENQVGVIPPATTGPGIDAPGTIFYGTVNASYQVFGKSQALTIDNTTVPPTVNINGSAPQTLASIVAGSNVVLTPNVPAAGNLTIAVASAPSFTSETLTATLNQLVLGTTSTTTITAPTPGGSRVVTLPDAGGPSSIVLSTAGALKITNAGSASQVLTLASAGQATWQAAGGGGAPTMWVFTEQYASGTAGPAISATTWTQRALNTTQSAVGPLATNVRLAIAPAGAHQLLVQPGTYAINANTVGAAVSAFANHITRIQNITAATTLAVGNSTFDPSGAEQLVSTIAAVVIIGAANTVIELDDWFANAGGFGGNAIGAGVAEVYTQLTIQQLA